MTGLAVHLATAALTVQSPDCEHYCMSEEACPAIGYSGLLRTGDHGGFTFRLRAGQERNGDRTKRISSGSAPTFGSACGGTAACGPSAAARATGS
jgi:hypothetical protein